MNESNKNDRLIPMNQVLNYIKSKTTTPLGEVISYTMSSKINKGPKEIELELSQLKSKENPLPSESQIENFMINSAYTFKPVDYQLKAKCFEVYKERCITLINVVMMLADLMPADKELLSTLDIQFYGDCVSTRDIKRTVIPLLENYKKLKEAKSILEDAKSYTRKISPAVYSDYVPPRTVLQPSHLGDSTREYVPMTQKQEDEARQSLNKTVEKIFKMME